MDWDLVDENLASSCLKPQDIYPCQADGGVDTPSFPNALGPGTSDAYLMAVAAAAVAARAAAAVAVTPNPAVAGAGVDGGCNGGRHFQQLRCFRE